MPNEESAEIRELESLKKQIRVWRSSLTAIFGTVTLMSLIILWSAMNGLAQNGEQQQRFIEAASANIQKDVVPDIEQLGMTTVHEIDFAGEFKKLNERAPDLANASAEQLQQLAKHLPERGEKVLNSELDGFFSSRKDKLKAEFPQATDEQVTALLTNLTSETHTQVTSIADSLFTPHLESLNNIVADLNKIEASESPNIKGEIPTWQMAFLVADIARADINSLDNGDDKDKDQPKPAAAKKK